MLITGEVKAKGQGREDFRYETTRAKYRVSQTGDKNTEIFFYQGFAADTFLYQRKIFWVKSEGFSWLLISTYF